MNISTFNDLLVTLASAAGAGALSSWILENLEYFQSRSKGFKSFASMIVAIVIALIAASVNRFIPEAVRTELIWVASYVLPIVSSYVAQQMWHNVNKLNSSP